MLVKDTTVNDKPLNAVVIPEVMVRDEVELKISSKRKSTTINFFFFLEMNKKCMLLKEAIQ